MCSIELTARLRFVLWKQLSEKRSCCGNSCRKNNRSTTKILTREFQSIRTFKPTSETTDRYRTAAPRRRPADPQQIHRLRHRASIQFTVHTAPLVRHQLRTFIYFKEQMHVLNVRHRFLLILVRTLSVSHYQIRTHLNMEV